MTLQSQVQRLNYYTIETPK